MADTDAATAEAAAQAAAYRDSLEKLRTRTDTAAKALAALGTAGLTAIGIEKVTDVFPYPDGAFPWVALALFGFLGMVSVIVAFTIRLGKASEPLNTSSDPSLMGMKPEEAEEVNAVYDRMAKLNGADSLLAYEKRARDKQQEADASDDPAARGRLSEQAARIRAEVRATQASAAHAVVSRRLRCALSDRSAQSLGASFVISLLVFGVAVDRIDSERTAQASALKGCADAIEAKVPAEALPAFCDKAVPARPAATTSQQRAATRLSNLATLYGTCVDAAVRDKQPLTTCESIRRRINHATK